MIWRRIADEHTQRLGQAARSNKPNYSAKDGQNKERCVVNDLSDIVAAEIIKDLQSALEELQAIPDDLALTPGAQEGAHG